MSKLTERQKKFVDEYLIDFNATQAAIRAKYSKNRAAEIGYQLLHKTTVQAYIQAKQLKLQQKTEINAERVLRELAAIGFYDISDFVRVSKDDAGRLDVQMALTMDIPPEKRAAIVGIKQGANGIEIKLADKQRALELIGNHIGMFNTKTPQINGDAESENLFDAIKESVKKDEV